VDEDDAIRTATNRLREEHGLVTPPLDALGLLREQGVTVLDQPFEALLREMGIDPTLIRNVDAMLDPNEMCVAVREDMPEVRKTWGYVHELAHKALEWQRELLTIYNCPIQRLVPQTRRDMEREANKFAAEMLFFGDRFANESHQDEIGLRVPFALRLTYGVSFHASFRRYVEVSKQSCALLVWNKYPVGGGLFPEFGLELSYSIYSAIFDLKFRRGLKLPSDHPLSRMLNGGQLNKILTHDSVSVNSGDRRFHGESFHNQYNVFTLIWD
jgi:hypothetical protein